MHHNPIIIEKNAIFIADSHHSSFYQNTLDSLFIELLESKKRQIFLMGDIFDFLVGLVPQSIKDNQSTLELLEQLALKHKVYYLEGNHDFLLKTIPYFKNIHCFPLNKQPVLCQFNNKNVYLAHGDIFLSWHYKLFSTIIRNPHLLTFLNLFSKILYSKIIDFLKNKSIKKKRANIYYSQDFAQFAQIRIKKYIRKMSIPSNSYIIEGHFHKGNLAKSQKINYVSLPFFACKKKYFIVKCADNCLTLKES
ncbi:UDP-2,3-diacylglucosamine diphosphatase [Helicobacter winghamensis]|uniref:UDP-2,3-diacylglucosamine diphosphatase n=1 Tax=Helicobacter winghamensis TaxID=157268 RepID=UPI0001A27E70|nr:metallophosphoesterase [Helicobacter winghamensis]EEO25918.1 Ser/Thr phosphatase family protein [Helicobacter winghamensis ATCC BAA-430]PKT76935.1 metallophosphoesterase [Helicobacter winghamensis]PKT77075.1 metallophosphoesterase [Helicobacter winghamensis]